MSKNKRNFADVVRRDLANNPELAAMVEKQQKEEAEEHAELLHRLCKFEPLLDETPADYAWFCDLPYGEAPFSVGTNELNLTMDRRGKLWLNTVDDEKEVEVSVCISKRPLRGQVLMLCMALAELANKEAP